jgi:YNFM family putative membrane transporter
LRPSSAVQSGVTGAAKSREAIQLLSLAAFNAGISHRCVEPMLPKLADEFAVSVSAASVVMTTYAFAYAASLLLQGAAGDRFGKLRVVTIGMALAGVASLACALSWDLGSLAAARLFTGMFASASVALGMAYIGDVVPLGERQATLAQFIAGSLLGQMVGPLVGGVFTDWLGWRASFALLGSVFLCVALVLFIRTRPTWTAPLTAAVNFVGIYRGLLRRTPMRWLIAVGAAESFLFFGPFAFIGAFLKLRFDLSFTAIGLLLMGYGLGGLLYTATARFFIRTLGDRGMALLGGILCGLSFLAVALVPDWTYAIPCTIGLGLGFYLLHNTVQTKATEVAPEARGSAVALYATGWAFGQAVGVAAIGLAITATGYAPALVACGVGFALLGLWLRLNMQRLKP